jgi:tetratricopeptide (TPR) repeat protein
MMKKISYVVLLFLFINCVPSYVEHVMTPQGGVLKLGNVTFEIPENSIAETTLIRVERKIVTRRMYNQGFILTGEKFIITPENLMFDNPIVLSYPGQAESTTLGAYIGNGIVPIAGTEIKGDTLRANIWHGGTYYVVSKPDTYGIIDHSDSKEALLIVCDIYVSDYVKDLSRALRWGGYRLPIWEFIYSTEYTIEDNARLLAEELKNLHNQYGEFTLDVVSFGIGGLITHRYVADTALYQRDLSPAIITIGTPFYGSNFAHLDSVKKAKSPYRYFFIDGLGKHAHALAPESELIDWIKTHRNLRGGWLNDPKEDKNPASLRGKAEFPGVLPEEQAGDGLVSLSSTMLTAIEPEPFNLSHFDLYEDDDVLKIVTEFVKLYRSFAWMDLFLNVWTDDEPFKKISDIWTKEAKLNFRNTVDFEVLLEFNENILTSAPHNGILITNGDNDTYPAWFLQLTGMRTDVLIVNRSLFNLKEYAQYLQRQGLPLEISEEALDDVQHYRDDTGEFVTISDQLIKILLRQHERPVVFATTVYDPQRYGVTLRLSGMVYEIGEESVNIERTKQLLYEEFHYDKIFSVSIETLNANIQNLVANYAASARMLSIALKEQKEYTEALRAIRFARRFVSNRWEYMPYYYEASIYLAMGEYEVADSMYKMILNMPSVSSDVKQDIALVYQHEYGQSEVAIKILAECLKDNPGDKRIVELIGKFQEEL